ncbi:MAG TPA: PIN domain-containing protein [Thermoanaerobaculia bacterium]|nr:PIN domain-containing protein [Thermoanaerobaculia bacterium]
MIERLALDTSAAVDYIREGRESPPQVNTAKNVVIPLMVLGELFHGASCSALPDASRAIVESIIELWQPLLPNVETARIYGEIRAATFRTTKNLGMSKMNDLWIAALCIQHRYPLLTNDRGFDRIAGLTVIHW